MEEHPLPVPRSIGGRILYALVTVVLPVPCFLLADVLNPAWQTGELAGYTAILLGPSVTLFFAPLLAYAVACLVLLLVAPRRFARYFVVRLGIYGGFFLALQYAILLGITMSGRSFLLPILGSLVLCALAWLVSWGYGIGQRRFGQVAMRLVTVVLVGACIVLVAVASLLSHGAALIYPLILLLAGAPFWCLDIAAVVSFRLLRHYELEGRLAAWRVIGPVAWLGGFGAAWWFALLRMGEVYATLPPYPPDCYVATAAANGHPRLVRSWPARARDGRPFRANRQLQRCKCIELALQAAWPAGHRRLRRAYDALGPRLARRMHHPLLADAAYLLLKPAEWISWAALRALLPQVEDLAGRLYTKEIPCTY